MKIVGKQFIGEKPSFRMEIPYMRTERKNFYTKKEFDDVKILTFESSVLVTISRVLKLVSILPNELIGSTKHDVSNNILIKHKDDIVNIIALSIQNNRNEVDPELKKFIHENFTSDHLMEALNYVMVCLNLESLLMGCMLFKPSVLDSFGNAKAREPEIRRITSC